LFQIVREAHDRGLRGDKLFEKRFIASLRRRADTLSRISRMLLKLIFELFDAICEGLSTHVVLRVLLLRLCKFLLLLRVLLLRVCKLLLQYSLLLFPFFFAGGCTATFIL
jgi:hypothetical protein